MTSEPIPGTTRWPPVVLDPAGPFAGPIETVAWVLFVMAGVVLALVLAALGVALFGPRPWRQRVGAERLVWVGGLAFPVVVLTGLLIYGLSTTAKLSAEPRPGEMRIRVTGEMWWWRVAYLDERGREVLQDANEIRIPVGRPVVLELESADVIHSFWAPRLGGKTDMIPGRRNFMRLQADAPGDYQGQCAEYCGGPHALMGLTVVALEPERFAAWRQMQAQEAKPVAAPQTAPLIERGRQVFDASGCGACHTIRGTDANGLAGPDLTHVGGRRTLGAGILPNNQGTLAGWIADSQGIKPGNRMPSYPVLSGRDLRAVAAYLDSLK
ncbi:cytochrome c oxidase subunit II [Caulobacter segnis]|uniref:cytochrome c oxidase subunit II n=1 Tax=Caulobacter segnis TaxID=88688 RepID=UPI0024106D3C|nr:cytochrome c oxidase subunit II [Caulobacter segnis]MDG2520684.1 cytochrome c oxidase subunit II [Caulobacter segnis]